MRLRRILAAAVPATLISSVLVLAAGILPASASQGGVCETFGSWCIGSPGSPGSDATTVSLPGRTITFAAGPGGTGTLHPTTGGGSALCLAPAGPNNLVVEWRLCNVTGVSWTWVTAGTSHYFVSVHYTGLRLSGDGTKGDVLVACPPGGCNGNDTLQQWNGP